MKTSEKTQYQGGVIEEVDEELTRIDRLEPKNTTKFNEVDE